MSLALKGNVRRHYVRNDIFDKAVTLLKRNDMRGLKGDLTFIDDICQLIEDEVPANNSKKLKINKRELALDICSAVFDGLSDLEKAQIGRHIDYIVESKGFQKISRFARIGRWFCRRNDTLNTQKKE